MFKNRKILLITAALAMFMCAISFVVFAAFETSQTYDTTVSTHKISAQTVTGPTEPQNVELTTDEKKSFTYTVSNVDAMNYVYSYSLIVSNASDINLLNSVFVYADDVFVGTLRDFVTEKDLGINKIVFGGSEDTPSTDDTKISYQLHNTSFTELSANITVNCTIRTPDVVNYYFVSNESELSLAINDVNVVSYTNATPTIILTSDITTTAEYTISDSCNIDLCGNTLTLGANIDIASDLHVYDSKNGGSITKLADTTYVLLVDGADALLTSDIAIDSTLYEITSISSSKLATYLESELSEYKYFVSGTPYDVFGFEGIYFNTYASLSVEGVTVDDITQMIITSITTNEVQTIQVVVGEEERTLEMLVYGDDEAEMLTEILTYDLVHLAQFSNEDVYIKAGYDLYLPTTIKEHGVTISWWSSDESVLSHSGKLHEIQGNVDLIATIKIYDKVYTHTYRVRGAKQDDMDKLLYLAGKIELTLNLTSVNSPINLPTADNYMTFYQTTNANGEVEGAIEDLGIEEISYSLESAYYYVSYLPTYKSSGTSLITPDSASLSSAQILLNQVTFQKFARIQISAKFAGNDEILFTYMKILITVSPTDIADKIYGYVQSYLNSVDVLQNILDTRASNGIINESGDFALPNVYEDFSIKYFFKDANNNIIYENGVVSLNNDNDLSEIQIVSIDLEKLNLTQTRIMMYAQVLVGEGDTQVVATEKEVFFTIPPAITASNFPAFSTLTSDGSLTDAGEIFYNLKLQSLQQSTENPYYKVVITNVSDETTTTQVNELAEGQTLGTVENVEYSNADYITDDASKGKHIYVLATRTTTTIEFVEIYEVDPETQEKVDNSYYLITERVVLNNEEYYLLTDTSYNEIKALKQYILLYDIENTQELHFEFGRVDTVLNRYALEDFQELLNWATSTTVQDIPSNVKQQLNSTVTWIQSDDSSDLSDHEIYVILHYAERFPAFQSVWGNYIKVYDNVLSDIDYNTLLSVIIDPYYSTILDWVTTTSGDVRTINDVLFEKVGSSPLTDDLGSEINDLSTISSEEERVIVYYVLSQKDRVLFETFYNLWKQYINRNDDVVTSNTFAVSSSTTSYNKPGSDGSSTTVTLNPCYDPIFNKIIDWSTFIGGSGTNIALADYLANNASGYNFNYSSIITNVANNLYGFASASRLGLTVYGHCTTDVELAAIKEYITKCYGHEEAFNFIDASDVSANYVMYEDYSYFVQIYVFDGTTKIPVNADGVVRASRLGNTDKHTPHLTTEYLNYLIGIVNESYLALNNDSNLKTAYSWATSVVSSSTEFSSSEYVISFTETDAEGETVYHEYYKDGYGSTGNYIISFDEHNLITKRISDVFAEYPNVNSAVKDYVIDQLGLDLAFVNDVENLPTDEKTAIMNAVDKQTDFDTIIENILALGTSEPGDVYYDNIPTISEAEFQYLLNFILTTSAYESKRSDFIKALSNVITSYGYDETTSEYYENPEIIRSLSSSRYALEDEVYKLIGNENKDQRYMYIPIDYIEETSQFEVIKYYTALTTISFKGNSLDFLFLENSMANNLFALICNSSNTLQKITFNYTRLSSIDFIQNLETLEYLDFRGNESGEGYLGISSLNPLLDLLAAKNNLYGHDSTLHDHKVTYMNFYMTDVDFSKEKYKFVKMYLAYSASNPTYYYDENEVEKSYELKASDQEKVLVEALFSLSSFKDVTYKYFFLPSEIYYSSTQTYNITWERISGAFILTNETGWRIERSSSVVGDKNVYAAAENCMISATIYDDNGNSYTRYFTFNMLEYSENIE